MGLVEKVERVEKVKKVKKVPLAKTVRPYLKKDKLEIIELIDHVWGKQLRDDYEHFWDWRHFWDEECERPASLSKVVEQDGEVLGYSGSVPFQLKLGKHQMTAGFGMDTLVHPKGRGLGIKLMRKILKHSTVFLGSGTNRAATTWHKVSGQQDWKIGRLVKLIHLVDPTELLVKRNYPAFLGKPIQWMLSIYRFFNMAILGRNDKNYDLQNIQRFTEEINPLCENFTNRHMHINMRNADYLNWRFVDSPFSYEIALLKDRAEICGYIVYKVGMLHGRKVMLLVEAVAHGTEENEENYFGILVRHVLKIASKQKVSDVQTMKSGSSPLQKALKKHAFMSKAEDQYIIAGVNEELGLDDTEIADFFDLNNWYFSMGDSDFEFIFFDQIPSQIFKKSTSNV